MAERRIRPARAAGEIKARVVVAAEDREPLASAVLAHYAGRRVEAYPSVRTARYLLACAVDSTASLQSLAENVEFVNMPARRRGQVLVTDAGTKLVYKSRGGGTMFVVK